MKKIFVVFLIAIVSILISSCDSTTDPITPVVETGKLFITSTPSGAQIWIGGSNSGKVTSDSLTLTPGQYTVELKSLEYFDTTFTVSVVNNETTTKNIALESSLVQFGPVTIFERLAAPPSGLDLSAGTNISIGTSSTNRLNADVYYESTGFVIQSANLFDNLTRVTKLKSGNSNNINDGLNSPVVDNTWITGVKDTVTTYFYLYDNDGNYSKARITGRGSNPDAYVEITWWYNKEVGDIGF